MTNQQSDMEDGKKSADNKSTLRHIFNISIRIKALTMLLIIMIFGIICAIISNPTEKEMVRYINKTGIRTKPHKSGGTVWAFDGLSTRNNYLVFSTFRLIFGDTGPLENVPETKTWWGSKIYLGVFGFYISITPGIRRLNIGESYRRVHWEGDDFEWPYDKNGDPIITDK